MIFCKSSVALLKRFSGKHEKSIFSDILHLFDDSAFEVELVEVPSPSYDGSTIGIIIFSICEKITLLNTLTKSIFDVQHLRQVF